jgi:hypothetical protein
MAGWASASSCNRINCSFSSLSSRLIVSFQTYMSEEELRVMKTHYNIANGERWRATTIGYFVITAADCQLACTWQLMEYIFSCFYFIFNNSSVHMHMQILIMNSMPLDMQVADHMNSLFTALSASFSACITYALALRRPLCRWKYSTEHAARSRVRH